MAKADQSKSQIIRLSHADGHVSVEPEDEDRFVITAQSAVKTCQASHPREEAIKTFKQEFVNPLFDWCKTHIGRIQACYIPVPGTQIQVFVVGISPKYDFDLGKELAALELQLFDAGWQTVSILQIPKSSVEELQTFFNTRGAIEVYAQFEATPGQGAA
jgi:hypothetical protein